MSARLPRRAEARQQTWSAGPQAGDARRGDEAGRPDRRPGARLFRGL